MMLAGSRSRCMVAAMAACVALATGVHAAEPFPIQDGDRIVLVGSTFIERDVRYGCIETLMTVQFRDYALTFRNLGWSGDEVSGIARASFDPVSKGYERLVNQIKDAAPTVLLISYGHNESFNGAGGLDDFIAGYAKLLDDVAPLNARIVLISPTLQHEMGAPLPDPTDHNKDVRLYADAIATLAAKRELRFIDMTKALSFPEELPLSHWTDNGVHFTEAGYWKVASTLLDALGYPAIPPDSEQLAAIRRVINEKNRLFFLKWRPQNETYLTGFREHEQGKYAAEIPLFDPLVTEQEKTISDLRIAMSKDGARR
jgi:lysophospholipase L1-like esterase